ncbi:MAG: retroviral-like aspartic protease family protein [Chloroflexota bacterium]
MYSHDYNSNYHPPMPVVEIWVSSLENPGEGVALTALVDSGSDTTFIPITHLQTLKAERVRKARVRGIRGGSYSVDMYMVKIVIGPYELFGVRAVGDKQGEVILGRNVLNELIVTLNGLAHEVVLSR